MPHPAAELGLARSWLVSRDLTDREIATLGETALRCATPGLRDVLALRATGGGMTADEVGAHLDSHGRWPPGALDRPAAALALACQWAVGGEQIRNQPRARVAFADLLATCGPGVFAQMKRSEQLAVQLPWFAGDFTEARDLMRALPLAPEAAADLETDLANPWATGVEPTPDRVRQWLALFNRRVRDAGLAPVSVAADADNPFDALTAPTGPSVDGPLVTVIMPSYAPDAGLLNSIRSMAAQTYGNLEVLLVDDASGPAYGGLYDEACALDPRVRLVRMARNGGSYLGRNAALAQAKGRYITTQDADDWSHPDRMAHQVALLEANPLAPASRSDAIRALDDLSLQWLGYDSQRRNASSLMLRRSTLAAIGGFDTTRKGADSEMHERLERRLGPTLDTMTPLAITRLRLGSLSRSDFRYQWMSPDRVLYSTSYRAYHRSLTPQTPPLNPAEQVRHRAFPAPRAYQRALPGGATLPERYDVVYLLDLSLPNALDGAAGTNLLGRGLRAAMIHQEAAGVGPRRRPMTFGTAIQHALDRRVDLISTVDAVPCELLIVLTPEVLELPSEDRPQVRPQHLAVLATADGETQIDQLAVLEGAREVFDLPVEFLVGNLREAEEWQQVTGEPTRTVRGALGELAAAKRSATETP